jgi:hypothetical protein
MDANDGVVMVAVAVHCRNAAPAEAYRSKFGVLILSPNTASARSESIPSNSTFGDFNEISS